MYLSLSDIVLIYSASTGEDVSPNNSTTAERKHQAIRRIPSGAQKLLSESAAQY